MKRLTDKMNDLAVKGYVKGMQARAKLAEVFSQKSGVLVSFVGSYAGASIALNLPPEVFEIILLVLLPIVAAIVLRKRKHDSEHIDMPRLLAPDTGGL